MPEGSAEEQQVLREAREAAERKRAAWIVLGTVFVGLVVLIVAAVVLMQP